MPEKSSAPDAESIFHELNGLGEIRLMKMVEAVSGKESKIEIYRRWKIERSHLQEKKSADKLIEAIKNFSSEKRRFLYFIEVPTQSNMDDIQKAFEAQSKRGHDGRAYSRINNQKSPCLYVGRSDELPSRIRQHLGYGPSRTYSLQLKHWASQLPLDFELHCAGYPKTIEDDLFQVLEDQLWAEKRPMFGRRGPR
jgi:hypothetical protein